MVESRFAVEQIDPLWVGDITYLPTWEGWLYLAVLLDACSRQVVGWAMAEHLGGELTRDASAMAYQALLAKHDLAVSMSGAGECDGNAMAESFMATLKTELIDRQPWPTRRAARRAIFDWIEGFYNWRLHSALGYQSPGDFDEALTTVKLVA